VDYVGKRLGRYRVERGHAFVCSGATTAIFAEFEEKLQVITNPITKSLLPLGLKGLVVLL
jgi:hypothetical protein